MHVEDAVSLALPQRAARGPVTTRRLRRFVLALGGIQAVSAVLACVIDYTPIRAFALGVMLPGAGFLYGTEDAWLAGTLALLTIAALLASGVWWTIVGNVLAPPTVLLGSALAAAIAAGTSVRANVVTGAILVVIVLWLAAITVDAVKRRTYRRRRSVRNSYLTTAPAPLVKPPAHRIAELNVEDLAHQRWLLHIALQPIDGFAGFNRLDQFSFSALRYQINFCQYALAMAQRHHTPAFHGYLSAAQRNLIEKMLQPRVWRYWRLENLWGNLDASPDPIRRANIMFSGYFGLMLSLYRNASGDARYDAPRSLVFRTRGGREFAYDHPAIMRIVARQFIDEASGLWACEPGFAYPMCNALGAAGVVGAEAHHGQQLADTVLAAMRRGLAEEYTYPDGSIASVRSIRFGFATPGVGTGSIMGSWQRANFPLLLRPVDPTAAQRLWEILRREDAQLVDGSFTLPRINMSDKRDVGNLGGSLANFWSCLYADAREFGDVQIADAVRLVAEQTLQPRTRDGARAYANASVYSNAIFCLGRFIDEHGYTDAVTSPLPAQWASGPILADAPYPECLVALAETDGKALRLVVRPGARPCRVSLSISRLRPNGEYAIAGAVSGAAAADRHGNANIEVDLEDRNVITIYPRC